MTDKISLKDFYQKLNTHDWTYDYSDDHSVWKRGRAAQGDIEALAKQSPEHQKLYDAFYNYVWKKEPKPEEPKEEA